MSKKKRKKSSIAKERSRAQRAMKHKARKTARGASLPPSPHRDPLPTSHSASVEGPSLLGIRPGSKDLLGIHPTWDGVVERIAQYSLPQIFELAGRVSAVLFHEGLTPPKVQHRLCSALLEDSCSAPQFVRQIQESTVLSFASTAVAA